ncbi:MAG: segregation/condensation protein A [Actinomycetota bacterium]|nr:segregation/condensation protein A [Actinomycetota bacterium]
MPYEVQTPVFEGPFDLLLHLITRDEVDLWEVSLSGIVDAYVTEVERMGAVDLDAATEFLLIAAILVELKAQRLLPGRDDIDIDEELALYEERDLLLSKLLECKTFRDAGDALARMALAASRSVPRTAGLEPRFLTLMPDLLAGVSAADVHAAFVRVSTPKPVPTVDLHHVAPIRVSVGEVVEELAAWLPARGFITFRTLTEGLTSRIDVVVHFLALLELYKNGLVDLGQGQNFGELEISWIADGAAVGAGA